MRKQSRSDHLENEKRCMPVRRGKRKTIERLLSQFDESTRMAGFLSKFIKMPGKKQLPDGSHLACSEALASRGRYRDSLKPLSSAVEKRIGDKPTIEIALARAGLSALEFNLPLDHRPIAEELGLSGTDTGSMLKVKVRERSKRTKVLPEIERELLRAELLNDRASIVESEDLRRVYRIAANRSYHKAMSLSEELTGEISNYHKARCMKLFGTWLLSIGDMGKGLETLEICRDIADRNGFVILRTEVDLTIAFYSDDEPLTEVSISSAEKTSELIKNPIMLAEARYIMGEKEAAKYEGNIKGMEGAKKILGSADILEGIGDETGAALNNIKGVLWVIRSISIKYNEKTDFGLRIQPQEIRDMSKRLKRAVKTMRKAGEREGEMLGLAVNVYLQIKSDNRKKAKKALFYLIERHPIKQYPEAFNVLKEAVSLADWLRQDKDTAHLFEDEPVFTIDEEAVNEIIRRAKEAYPNEFGAMLSGIEHISHVIPIMEGAGGRSTFMFSLFSRFSQRSVEGEGVVHSHPSGSTRPSRADLSMFGRFPGINIIIGYPFEPRSLSAYDRMGNKVRLEIIRNK